MSDEELHQAWRVFLACRDPVARDSLIRNYLPLADRCVEAFAEVIVRPVEIDDVKQEAYLAVVRGVDSYTPGLASHGRWLRVFIRRRIARLLNREYRNQTLLLEIVNECNERLKSKRWRACDGE